jgi:hypothetical protein
MKVFIDKMSGNQGEKACHCRNGGICHANSNHGKLCQCPNGFTGQFCETAICKFDRINNE